MYAHKNIKIVFSSRRQALKKQPNKQASCHHVVIRESIIFDMCFHNHHQLTSLRESEASLIFNGSIIALLIPDRHMQVLVRCSALPHHACFNGHVWCHERVPKHLLLRTSRPKTYLLVSQMKIFIDFFLNMSFNI